VFAELTVSTEGFILRDVRLVIPESLQERIIDIAHEGHLGIVKTKRLIRSKVWFPSIDKQVERKIHNCLACQATDKSGSFPTPVKMSLMPNQPWEYVSIDFYGPIQPSKEYLMVTLDEYSRFPLVETIYATSSETVTKRLEQLFSIFGIPQELRSDNGPPFNSNSIGNFAKFMDFKHRLVTPEWPQANGMVESFMKNLSRVVRTAIIEKVPWKTRLVEFLRNYRSTPHSTTGIAPAELFFKNAKTTRLPQFKSSFVPTEADQKALRTDKQKKQVMKQEFDARKHARESDIKEDDIVLVKQKQIHKGMSPFEPSKYLVKAIKGNMVTASKITDNNQEARVTTRNISFFKKWRGERMKEQESIKYDHMSQTKVQPISKMTKVTIMTNRATQGKEVTNFQYGFEQFINVWNNRKIECKITEKAIVSEILNEIIEDSCEIAAWNELRDETSDELDEYSDAYKCKEESEPVDSSEDKNTGNYLDKSIQDVENQFNRLISVEHPKAEQILNPANYLEQTDDLEVSNENTRRLRPLNKNVNYRDNRKYETK
jgi:hypothetical protein